METAGSADHMGKSLLQTGESGMHDPVVIPRKEGPGDRFDQVHPLFRCPHMPVILYHSGIAARPEDPYAGTIQVTKSTSFHFTHRIQEGQFGIKGDRIREGSRPPDPADTSDFSGMSFPKLFDRPDIGPPLRPLVHSINHLPDFFQRFAERPDSCEMIFGHRTKLSKGPAIKRTVILKKSGFSRSHPDPLHTPGSGGQCASRIKQMCSRMFLKRSSHLLSRLLSRSFSAYLCIPVENIITPRYG